MNINIREACSDDYISICSLVNNELGYPNVNIDDLTSRIELMNQDENYRTFVALLDDNVVGFIGMVQEIAFEISGSYMRINAFAVSKEHQNKGIGRALLKFAEDYANEKGITVFTLNIGFQRLNTHIFYERNGYIKKSFGFWKGV